jgi:hypothetical protein
MLPPAKNNKEGLLMAYKEIKNVEIFRAGTWRGADSPPGGDHYTRKDLQEMVNAFNRGAVTPMIKITHPSMAG